MGRLRDTFQFSLLQALHHGHLTDRGTNRSKLNSQSHARWSWSKCSFQHAFPEMCAHPKEIRLPVWYWITFSVCGATLDLLLYLKPAKTGTWSYGNRGIMLTELLWRYWVKHHWRFGGFQLSHTASYTISLQENLKQWNWRFFKQQYSLTWHRATCTTLEDRNCHGK